MCQYYNDRHGICLCHRRVSVGNLPEYLHKTHPHVANIRYNRIMKITVTDLHPIRWLSLFIFVFVSACSSPVTPASSDTPTPLARMTIVESAIRTPTDTPGAYPTLTPHIFCEGSPESFLIVGERGRVTHTDDGETLNLRSGPGVDYTILKQMEPLESFFVLDGPQCNTEDEYTWFQIDYDGQVGWIAEGDENQYYAEPFLTG